MKKELVIVVIMLLMTTIVHAQINTVDGFNYYDINHSAFTVDGSCLNIDVEAKREIEYWYTSLDLAETVTSVFAGGNENTEEINGDYKILKDHYTNIELGGEPYKWILIRPNDNVQRPVVVLTHGGSTSDATTQRVLPLGTYDYVQRGYAVVYYQSGPSTAGNVNQALLDANLSPECQVSGSIDFDNNCFQQGVYLKILFARAAIQYTMAMADEYNLKQDELFISGFSGGGVGSLYAALATEENFSDEMFTDIGNFNKLSKFPNQEYDVKALTSIAGGVLDESSASLKITGDLFKSTNTTRYFMMHGQDDTAVKADIGPLQWVDPAQELTGSRIASAIKLKELMDEEGIENKVVINCSAGHSIISYPCEFNDDDFANNPSFSVGIPPVCLKWALPENWSGYNYNNLCSSENARPYGNELVYTLMQFHDMAKMSAAYFSEDVAANGPAKLDDPFINSIFDANDISTVLPTKFPYDENSNQLQDGHLTLSDRCLKQECSTLYFDKFGIGNSILLLGDFIQLDGASLSKFNNDFTIEMKIKEINQIGKGVLFSHLNNFLLGFEISINNQGKLQFNKNVSGGGVIEGDVTLLDGKPHHIAVTREGNEFSLYLDGEQMDVSKNWNIDFPNSSKMRLGNTSNELENGNNGFNGVMKYFRVWDTVLEVSEFDNDDLNASTNNLLADFEFDQRFGEVISSSNDEFTMTLGGNENNVDYNPRWMDNDVQCEFDESVIISTENIATSSLDFLVYPNPSDGTIHLEFDSNDEKNIAIYSIEGKHILSVVSRENQTSFNIVNSGVYFVKVQKGAELVTKKVIVL